eukprot:gnl/TRDRNA2_/TRDRNA2_42262_c0_seq1.p1 gnl/TRDRNA2_/TRDRNA2_42262_c0~~gnl/TRDRNA2_/TRDRNA2_42262_c0_seq1.p1  ORF type:complete len:327 (-),score=63.22 gnl/TRDRNA2_/TRDRNA2_42262_c0_seq1:32-961(-)
MGNAVCKKTKFEKTNKIRSAHTRTRGLGGEPHPEPEPVDIEFVEPELPPPTQVRALVTYCDYGFEPAKSQGWVPPAMPGGTLDTKENADLIIELLKGAGVTDITLISNLDATSDDVLEKIQEVGSRCESGDLFFFFYSGHGDRLEDDDGDEDDGFDEAMCLPSKEGTCDRSTWLRDDDFALAISEVEAEQKLCIFDCCHSGSMCDFDKDIWEGQLAVSITGCKDTQEGAAMGGGTRGGAFSKALHAAVKAIGDEECDVATVYNRCLEEAPNFIPPNHEQDIQISTPADIHPGQMIWPLRFKGSGPIDLF